MEATANQCELLDIFVFANQLDRAVCKSLAKYRIAVPGVVKTFFAVQIVGIDPCTQRFISRDLFLGSADGVSAGVVLEMIAQPTNDDGNVGVFQIGAELLDRAVQRLVIRRLPTSLGIAFPLHPDECHGVRFLICPTLWSPPA